MKNQVVLSITILRQKKASETHKSVTDAMSASIAKKTQNGLRDTLVMLNAKLGVVVLKLIS